MKTRHRLALEAAARGLVSGTLEEWPLLAAALRESGHPLPLTAGLREMRAAAQDALGEDAPVAKEGCCEHCAEVGELREDVSVSRAILERVEKSMDKNMVTQGEFKPVRAIAYTLVLLMATAFVGALASGVMK